jgi:hypothetical protein
MSNTLWNYWMHKRPFRRDLLDNIARGASARFLLYDPDSSVLHLRASAEEDVPGEMQQEINSTLWRFAEIWDQLEDTSKRNLEVRLTTRSLHLVQLIRADEQMLIGLYLSGTGGGESPTMQLRGRKSVYFAKYAEQFNIMWKRGKPLDDNDFHQMLEKFRDMPSPPTED